MWCSLARMMEASGPNSIAGQRRTLTSSDQPHGALGLGEDTASTPERDLSASSGVKIVIRQPDPHALQSDR
jgi:hypothetical protein